MTDQIKEQLSSCLDGELPEGELDLLLKQVGRDPKLRASLGRYALVGEALRAQRPVVAPADFAMRVAAAIAQESVSQPSVQSPAQSLNESSHQSTRKSSTSWLRPVAGLAVAAGVAAIAVLAFQPSNETATPYLADVAAPPVSETTESPASYIVPAGTSSSGFAPATRLTNYVVAHSEYSTPLGRRSVLSGVLSDDDDESVEVMSETPDTMPETKVTTQP